MANNAPLFTLNLSSVKKSLEPVHAAHEAVDFIAKVLQRPRKELLHETSFLLNTEQIETLNAWLERRTQGEPLQHILGESEFYAHIYKITPDVLIPRQETEILIDHAIQTLSRYKPLCGIEIGVGSGILSIELLCAFPSLQMHSTDFSPLALEVAQANAKRLLSTSSDRLHLYKAERNTDVFESITALNHLDFIISNPPYLNLNTTEIEAEVLAHEPHEALAPPCGVSVLYFYERIAEFADLHLKSGAWVFLEIPHERAKAIATLFLNEKWNTQVINDLTSRPRVVAAQRKHAPCS